MPRLWILILVAAASVVVVVSCSLNEDGDAADDDLYQVSTLSALAAGGYDGLVDFEEVLDHGDYGLGTFDALDGELIVLDGVAYRVPADGVPVEVDDSVTTPFAVVTEWKADQSFDVTESMSCADLQSTIDTELDSLDNPYAVKVTGEFAAMTARSEDRQEPPYAPLSDVLEDQIIFELDDVSATMVGFRLPEYMDGANAVGYHFHAVTDDLNAGGHVLDCVATTVTVEIDDIDTWTVDLP